MFGSQLESERHTCKGLLCFCKDSPACTPDAYDHIYTDGRCRRCGLAEPLEES